MFKKKSVLITFEGIEGSGKSYQSRKLFNNIKKLHLPVIMTREPGGTGSAEKIRELILKDYFHPKSREKFDKYTDTLLYLAARNEHVKNKIRPAISKKYVVICDRFIDSTLAYQVYGKGVKKKFIDYIHKNIMGSLKPDLTIILKVNISKAYKRLNKRKKKNRYDKFSKSFYIKAQNSFIKIANNDKKRCFVLNNSEDSKLAERLILKRFLRVLNKKR